MIGPQTGTVVSFDPEVGIGRVVAVDEQGRSGPPLLFHCTAFADGSRTIAAGTAVRFEVGAGGPGRWEARNVTPTGDARRR